MSKPEQQPASGTRVLVEKFADPDRTATGEIRAFVPLGQLDTLWINTGTLCNIECINCYIESSPINDRLSYITTEEVIPFLDEIERDGLNTREIGFTGGEPFMNPDFPDMLEQVLERGFRALVLTNAMKPVQRPKIRAKLLALQQQYGNHITLRVSLDHYSKKLHDKERGNGAFDKALAGLDWLSENGFSLHIAGRTIWNESEESERRGYGELIAARNWNIDATDPGQLILFPELDEKQDVPEITTKCWGKLDIRPDAMMCASSRMVIKRKGASRPQVVPCTLIAYEPAFEMGHSLREAARADGGMFAGGAVKLCHPHCAKFCVLGGGSCSG